MWVYTQEGERSRREMDEDEGMEEGAAHDGMLNAHVYIYVHVIVHIHLHVHVCLCICVYTCKPAVIFTLHM